MARKLVRAGQAGCGWLDAGTKKMHPVYFDRQGRQTMFPLFLYIQLVQQSNRKGRSRWTVHCWRCWTVGRLEARANLERFRSEGVWCVKPTSGVLQVNNSHLFVFFTRAVSFVLVRVIGILPQVLLSHHCWAQTHCRANLHFTS